MFPLYFHYEDILRQDPLLKPNHANVMEVPGSCKIRLVPKAPSSIKNGKLAMEIPRGHKLIQTQRTSTGKSFRSNPFLGSNKDQKGYVSDLVRQSTLRGHGMSNFLIRISILLFMLLFFSSGFLLMDDLSRAVSQFYSGGGIEQLGGGGGFNPSPNPSTDFLPFNFNQEENQNPGSNLNPSFFSKYDIILDPRLEEPEPDIVAVKSRIKEGMSLFRNGKTSKPISNEEVHSIFHLKESIFAKMEELDPNPSFWNKYRMHLIQDHFTPRAGAEFSVPTLTRKLTDLFSEQASLSPTYKELMRLKDSLISSPK